MNETMYRAEDKYLCSERDMLLLESRLKVVMKPDVAAGGKPYRITSLYFDDPADSHWSDTEDGESCRKKHRIRIYNDSFDLIRLEVKYKAFNRVNKKSATISREEAARLIAGECIEDPAPSMDSPVTQFNLAIRQSLLRPRVVVDYVRNAYTFAPGNVRITFDRNIRISGSTDRFLEGGLSYMALRDVNRILEVKYDEFLPGFIAGLLEAGNMNQSAYSKYQLGREQLEEIRKCL